MEGSANLKPTRKVSKRRMELEKRVVKVKAAANTPPSDSWSWRKYGQKPIKGTPYPRGYYKCSTSKGCLAKKQVERSKDDASMVIITYTSDHNHSRADNQAHQKYQPISPTQAQQPLVLPEQEEPYVVTLKNICIQDDTEEKETVSWSEMIMSLSSQQGPKSGGENEVFDELGELPHTTASSSFTSFMKNYFFNEQMLVPHP